MGQFSIDAKNKVILFEHAVFSADALYVFPNQETVEKGNPLYNIAVPNASVEMNPAAVSASLVFEAERFSKTYGSGLRKGYKNIPALGYHALSMYGRFVEEIHYLDGEGADQKANQFARAITSQETTYSRGGFTRAGAGTELNGQIDRVSVSLGFDQGITETVEWAKERTESNFVAEREIERRQGTRDLYPGQQQTRREVAILQAISRVNNKSKASGSAHFGSISEVMQTPVGAVDCSPTLVVSADTWPAGSPVFLGDAGVPDPNGTRFAGIVIADNSSGRFAVATQGVIPVRVKVPVSIGDSVGIDPGAGQTAKRDGKNLIGTANAAYNGTEIVLLPVRLGSGGVSSSYPFELVGSVDKDGQGWISVNYGEVNQVPPSKGKDGELMNDGETYDMKADDDGVVYVAVQIETVNREVVGFYFSMAANEESMPKDGADDGGIFWVHFVIGRFYIDNSHEGEEGPNTPIPTNFVREHIGMTEYTVRRRGSWKRDYFRTFARDPLPASDSLSPFELNGYVRDGNAYVSIAYGEVNQVPPTEMTEGGDPVEFPVSANGVAYLSVRIDSKTFEVIDCHVSLAENDEAVPQDTDDGNYLTFGVIIGRFYLDSKGDPVAFNLINENVNFSTYPAIAADGRLCIDFFRTFSRDPLARDSMHLNVFNDANPTKSSMFMAVNDEDPDNDQMVFMGANNTLKLEWYYGPGIYCEDPDQYASRLSSVGVSFWDANGTKENPECDLSVERLRLWDNDGYGTHHYASGLAFWDNAANAGNPQCDLNLQRLSIWDNNGLATQHYASGVSFWTNTASSKNPQCDLNTEHLKIWNDSGYGERLTPLDLRFWDNAANEDNPPCILAMGYLKMWTDDGDGMIVTPSEFKLWNPESSQDNPKFKLNIEALNFWDMDGMGVHLDAGGISFWSNTSNQSAPQLDISIDAITLWSDGGLGTQMLPGGFSMWDNQANEDNPQLTVTPDFVELWDMDGQTTKVKAGAITLWDTVSSENTPRVNLSIEDLTFFDASGERGTDISNGEIVLGPDDGPKSDLTAEDLIFTDGTDTTDISAGEIDVGDTKITDGDINLGETGTVTVNGESYEPHTYQYFDSVSGTLKDVKILTYQVP